MEPSRSPVGYQDHMNKRQELEAARNMEPDCAYGAVGAGRYTRGVSERREAHTARTQVSRVLLDRDPSEGALRSPAPLRYPSAQSPITIEVVRQEDGLSFRLKADSHRRLQAQGIALPPVGSIHIGTTMRDDFETVHDPFARHVAPLLTNMPLDQLVVLGGVQFVSAGSSDVIWELRSLLTLVDKAKSHELDPTI